MDELIRKLREATEKMKAARVKLSEVSGKADAKPEDVTAAQTAFKTIKDEVLNLSKQLETAVEDAKVEKGVADVSKMAEELAGPDLTNKRLISPATARDADKEDKAHREAIAKYVLRGKSGLSDAELALCAPRSASFKDGADGMRVPKSMIARILGKSFAGGAPEEGIRFKAIPMESDHPTQGGFLFVPDFRAQLLRLPEEPPAMMPLTTVVPTASGTIQIPRLKQTDANEYGGVVCQWTAEGGQKPETEAAFEQVAIAASEISAYTEVTHRLLSRSAIDLEMLLAGLFRSALYDAVDRAILTGSGVGQPLGIIGTAGIRQVARQTAGQVRYDDLVKLKYAVRPYHRARGIFVCNDDVALGLELAKDILQRPLFTASTANGINDRLVGKPWLSSTRLPTVGNEGDIMFIDPAQYYMAMEEDVVFKRSDDYKFRNNCTAFAVFACVGGQLVQPRVCSVLTGAAS